MDVAVYAESSSSSSPSCSSLIYFFTGTNGSFQLSPFFNPHLCYRTTAGSVLISISCPELAANCEHRSVI